MRICLTLTYIFGHTFLFKKLFFYAYTKLMVKILTFKNIQNTKKRKYKFLLSLMLLLKLYVKLHYIEYVIIFIHSCIIYYHNLHMYTKYWYDICLYSIQFLGETPKKGGSVKKTQLIFSLMCSGRLRVLGKIWSKDWKKIL